MAEEPPKHQSWWQTLPGILTAVAGIITAATGLIVALNQAGVFHDKDKEKTNPSTPTPTATSSAGTSTKPAQGGRAVTFARKGDETALAPNTRFLSERGRTSRSRKRV